jgi:predicted RNA-binding protein with PUA-like domain
MAYWLVKSEPSCWSWEDHVKVGIEPWHGVRNFQAAKYIKEMNLGDLVFFYHSQKDKAVVGVLEVVSEAYPDPTDETMRFVSIDLKARYGLERPVTLKEIKDDPRLSEIKLLKQSRLSVMPMPDEAWEFICAKGGL